MTKIIKLGKEYDTADDFIDKIKGRKILVYEDVQGSKICVKYNGKRFIIKPKSIKNDELNFVDLTVQKFYNEAYSFFSGIPEHVRNLLNSDWWFIFEYFPDNQPANIEYNRKPKNDLILTCIVKSGRYIYNLQELVEYAKLFDIDHIPILFYGEISSTQLEILNLFLNTSEEDLKYLFDQTSFAKFFYDILNSNITNSFLMDSDNFNDNLEKIIIKLDNDDELSFEILNPMYKRLAVDNKTEYTEVYSLILVNFLEFCQLFNFKDLKVKGLTKDDIYVNLMCKLFNEYMRNTRVDILKWNFEIPQFFKEDKFKINVDLLKNNKTIEYIKIDGKLEYIFKIVLGSFNKRRKKPIGVFNDQTVTLFNQMVDGISKYIDTTLQINKEYKFQKSDLLNFNDFFDLKIDTDSEGRIYPDSYDKIQKDTEVGDDKKKGKGKFDMGNKFDMEGKQLKKESYDHTNLSNHDLAMKISKNLKIGEVLGEKSLNKFVTDQDMIIELTDNQSQADICNSLLLESVDNIINIYDVCKLSNSNLYAIIYDDYDELSEKYIDMTKSCVVAVSENNRVEEGDECYDLFLSIKHTQDELDAHGIQTTDFNTDQFGFRNDKLVFVDFEYTDGKRTPVEKVLDIQ